MQIRINENSEIVECILIGSTENGIECIIPDNVLNDNILSYKYIDGEFIKNPDYIIPTPPSPSLTLDDVITALADLDAQREADKLENQIAIAELAETILNGGVNNG